MTFIRILAALLAVSRLCAAITVSLAPSAPSPQPVGTTIIWTPTASDTNAGTLDYRFAVAAGTSKVFQILQDYDVSGTFPWTPYTHEGSYTVQVTARNTVSHQTATAAASFTFLAQTNAVGGAPVITPASNPLVALYSGPGCPTGSVFRVRFASGGTAYHTANIACAPTLSNNIYVAGMLPSTTYQMNYQIVTGSTLTSGPVQAFTTGAVPATLPFPTLSVPLSGSTDTQQVLLLLNPLPGTPPANYFPYATDLNGNVVWYYTGVPPVRPYNIRPAPGGTVLMLVANPSYPSLGQQLFREFDLAGNTIRQTSVQRLSQILTAQGKLGISEVNHDALRLPNGHTLVIASQEELFPPGTQGASGPGQVDVLGDAILDLDTNMQIAWSWSAYDHLDINRPAVLGETCPTAVGDLGCPPLHLASAANDWIHGNSLSMTTDGNILFSSRHQDFVYKIDYANGTGAGDVIWTLGLGGDFTISGTSDPYPWFSHQHDVEVETGTTTNITVYDNGNTRIHNNNRVGDSRGQQLTLNETALTASLNLNVDMGVFSIALGSSQLLDNGNYHFLSGWVPTGVTAAYAESVEVLPSGTIDYEMVNGTNVYRTYRMSTLYSIP